MRELEQELITLYNYTCCSHTTALPALAAEDDFATLLMSMVNDVWENKGLPKGYIDKNVTNAITKQLFTGVQLGYGKQLLEVDYDTPDFDMLEALKKNVSQFSAAKNYTQLRQLSNALIGEDGKLRTYSQFKEAVLQINDQQINQWLKAEYELAVASGQMAGKWVGITQNADALPYLEFDAVMDGRTTQICSGLNGTLLPIDDAFWKTYYPPNHFGCRSTVRQKSTGKVTMADNVPSAEIPAMFRVNLAQERLVFPPGHPYYKDLPKALK